MLNTRILRNSTRTISSIGRCIQILSNDPNAGHIMLTKFKDTWYYACDLIYDKISQKTI